MPDQPRPKCFVIMPFTSPAGYDPDHFTMVYEDLFAPACELAGFEPDRADQENATDIIPLTVVRRLLEAPMALCDLTAHNPNVFFELGVRQAFGKPVALVQEQGTPRVFDVAALRAVDYRRSLRHRDVERERKTIAGAIRSTFDRPPGSQSTFVEVLNITAAKLPAEPANTEGAKLDLLLSEIRSLQSRVSYSEGDSDYIDRFSRLMAVAVVIRRTLNEASAQLEQGADITQTLRVAEVDLENLEKFEAEFADSAPEKFVREMLELGTEVRKIRNKLALLRGIVTKS